MQSCWKELTDLHTFLTPAAVHTIDPKSWCSIISRTLSSLSCSDETKCPVSPELCQHCHQMLALSAVTTMALLAQDKREDHAGVEDVYLQPLLQPDLLKCMVALLQHRCQYLRRQSQKALTALSSLKRLTESMAEDLAERCVQAGVFLLQESMVEDLAGRCVRAVLHLTPGDVRGVEPLQLLCTLLSARSACAHRVRVADTLLPCLPALYRHVVCNAPSEPGSGVWLAAAETLASGDADVVRGSHGQTVSTSGAKRIRDDNTGEPPCKQTWADDTGDIPCKQTRTDDAGDIPCKQTRTDDAGEPPCKQTWTDDTGDIPCKQTRTDDAGEPPCKQTRTDDAGEPPCKQTWTDDTGDIPCKQTRTDDAGDIPCKQTRTDDAGEPPCKQTRTDDAGDIPCKQTRTDDAGEPPCKQTRTDNTGDIPCKQTRTDNTGDIPCKQTRTDDAGDIPCKQTRTDDAGEPPCKQTRTDNTGDIPCKQTRTDNTGDIPCKQTRTDNTGEPPCKQTRTDNTGEPPCKQTRTGCAQAQSLSAPFSVPGNESVQEVTNECEGTQDSAQSSAACSTSTEAVEHGSKEQNVCEAIDAERKLLDQYCSTVCHAGSVSTLDKHVQSEQQTGTLYRGVDQDVCSPLVDLSHSCHQAVMLHYAFLCLIQKCAKLCSFMEPVEKVKRMQVLQNTILSQLISDHAALFSSDCSRQSGDHLLVERKFLDIVDTTMDYIWLRTSKTLDGVYKEMAVRFVSCMLAADCSWSFPGQRTLIGGQCDQAGYGGDHPHGGTSICVSGSKGAEELLGAERSGHCSPVLVLLLAAVFKSCAIIFRSERGNTEQGEQMRACLSLLCSMDSHLQQLFGAGWGVERGTGGSPTCITWLAQVCGDQDDRWIEALLCALDIFLCLQVLSAASSGVLQLRTLLDPHALFLQLLELTHYNASLIIDWLTSPETCYLAYLTRYLRLLATDFSTFMRVASSSDVCRGSGSPPMYENSRLVMKDSEEGGSGKETVPVKRGPSSLSVQRHRLGVAAPGYSLVQGHPVSGPGVGPREGCLSESSETDQNTDARRLDKARESSLGMVLLSCYEDDSSVDDTGDESCDEESFSDAATDNSTEHDEDKNEACWGKHGTITEDEVKPSQSRGGSTGSETYCSDGDDNSLINPSVSQTEMQRTCHSPQSEHPYSPSPAKPQIVHAERREIRHSCHTACLDRVMQLLGEVRVKLEKLDRSGLLVYNPSPLVSLVRTCEGLFESQNGL